MTQGLEPDFTLKVPEGDDRPRRVCNHCSFVDYENPRVVTGSVAVAPDGRILLCKRAIEPRKGYWTLPAGFQEKGESVEEGAMREAVEEACASLEIDRLLAVYDVPRIAQVQIMFRARLVSDIAPGPESQEVQLVEWADIPWSELAFPTVVWALTHYAATRDQVSFAPFFNPTGTQRLTR